MTIGFSAASAVEGAGETEKVSHTFQPSRQRPGAWQSLVASFTTVSELGSLVALTDLKANAATDLSEVRPPKKFHPFEIPQ